MSDKCVHCGNETSLGVLLPNGDRVQPLHYGRHSGVRGYVDLVTSVADQWGLRPESIRLTITEDMSTAGYLILNATQLRQMLADAGTSA